MYKFIFPWQWIRSAIPGVALLLTCSTALAQGMYRVELIVFAYPPQGSSEQWEALPELAYSRGARKLGDQSDTASAAQSVTADIASLPSALPDMPAYAGLPSNTQELASQAAAMARSGRYRVLFHEAWLQPIGPQSEAVPVIADCAATGQDWPELQGTVRFYQSGQLTLETNLWLNTSGEYLPGTWRMPAPPRAPAVAPTPQSAYLAPAPSPSAQAGEPVAAEEVSNYPYRHAVLLRQTHTLQSGALLYIDHPMLGVLAKVSPVELAEPVAEPAEPPGQMTELPR